jgi:hypothetical protein
MVALEDLGMKLALPISGDLQVLDPTSCSDQVAGVVPIAIAFAPRVALSSAYSDQRVKFLAHHALQYHANGAASQLAQMLVECVLLRQRWGVSAPVLSQRYWVWYPSSDDEQA